MDQMDYNRIIDQIQSASLFDVYRLRCALDHILEDPKRLAELRHSLIPGRDVTYFSWKDNRLVEVTILELKQTRVLVREKGSARPYTIPMFWVNQPPAIRSGSDKLVLAALPKVTTCLKLSNMILPWA